MQIETYTPHWRKDVMALADRVLGTGYFSAPPENLATGQSCFYVCISPADEVAAFAYGEVLPADGLNAFLENRVAEIPADLAKADSEGVIGVIETVAVAPEHQGKGLGTKLLSILHDQLVGLGGDKLIASFKRGPSSRSVDKVMAKHGFEPWLELDSYLKDRCNSGEFGCVDRTEQCNCKALFFQKPVY